MRQTDRRIRGVAQQRRQLHCESEAGSFTVSAEVAGGSTGQSIDRDVGAHAVRQRQVLAVQAAQITGEVKIHHVEQGCEGPDDASLQRERDAMSSHLAAAASGPDRSRESAVTERQHTGKSLS